MLRITIENGQLLKDGNQIKLNQCSLGSKVQEVFEYLLSNNINLSFEKQNSKVSFTAIRPDLKRRLLNALMADKLIRHHGLSAA